MYNLHSNIHCIILTQIIQVHVYLYMTVSFHSEIHKYIMGGNLFEEMNY